MRKRLLSILLTLCMVLSLLPQVALAEDEVSYTSGGDITETGLDLSIAPNENMVYKAGNGVVLWQPSTNTLRMRDATIDTTGDAYALTLKYDSDVTIVADGTNVLKSNTNGIGQKNSDEPDPEPISTVIKGDGTIEVTSTGTTYSSSAIDLPYGPLTISGDVTVTPICENDGLCIPKGLTILDNASVTAPSNIKINTAYNKVNIDTTGTVTEFNTMSLSDLNYIKGDLKGALIWIVNNDGGTNRFYSVYGNYTLTKDQTIQDAPGEDGLTVMDSATLTIPEGVTLTVQDDTEDGNPQITNKGTIVNNGTIQFSNTATDAEILALSATGTFTGSGTVKRGDTEVFPLNGDVYVVAANVNTSGLDLYTSMPNKNTCYKAGSGYIMWQPTVESGVVKSGTLAMQDAEISSASTALKLPGSAPNQVDITIVAEGENSLSSNSNYGISHEGGATLVKGNGKLNIEGQKNGIYQQNGALTITGYVTANAKGGDGYCDIYTTDIIISENASVNATGSNADIYSGGNITINTTGTVNIPQIRAIKVFDLKAGTLTGSWVLEGKDDYYENEVNTVYGNVTVVGAEYIKDVSQLKGLTIMQGATLTIDNSGMLTIEDNPDVEGVPKITNNGTIVNNGTIKFPATTTGAEIQALNITGSGTIMIGDTEVTIINGVICPLGGDVGDKGLDLTLNTPTADTYYKAGNGYLFFSPSNGTLTLHNAEISVDQDKPLITLPQSNIKLVLEGENALTNNFNSDSYALIIQQGQIIETNGHSSAITPQAYTLTVSGDGSLGVNAKYDGNLPISTDGTFVMESGTIKSGDTSEYCCGISSADFKMIGGSLETSFGITISGNALIQGGTIFTPGNDGTFVCLGNFEMTGGTVTCGFSMFGGLLVGGSINKTGGTLNALVCKAETNSTPYTATFTPYGSAPMCTYYNDGSVKDIADIYLGNVSSYGSYKMNIPSGSTLTIPNGARLNLYKYMSGLKLSDYVTNNGTLVNNGMIILPEDSTAEDVKAAVGILKPTGIGIIGVAGNTPNVYNNNGEPMNLVQIPPLGETKLSGNGYTWDGNSTDGFTLTLDNAFVFAPNIYLPSNVPVTIDFNGNSFITGGIAFTQSGPYAAPCNLTIGGSGTITLSGGISGGGSNGDIVTVQGGAKVNVNDGINIGASGGQDGTLIVDGAGTSVNVTGQMGSGVYLDTLQLSGGAQMTVHSDEVGIFAHAGGVTITGGSTLTAGCNYGVYIIDGNLTLDSTSKLVTNASIAPFCVVDTTNSKADSVMASISNIPSGTQITSVKGTDEGYGYTYCSLVSTGGTLVAKDEGNEPANLSGTVKGTVTFAASHDNGGDNNNGGSNGSGDDNNGGGSGTSGGGGSSTNYTITATAGEGGSINPNGKVSVVSNGNKTFAITANKGYCVKDVLVDGVSVGEVSEYKFDNVTKSHTISASFAEIPEKTIDESNNIAVSYNDVKNSDWFKDAVGFVTEKGLMAGISEGKFGPNIYIDRGMLVTILWRLDGEPSISKAASFTDVDQDDYYAKAVAWATENKIVEGYGNGHFGPKDTITREQMAAILYRYTKFKGYDTTQGGMAVREFTDYASISNWALESVSWAVNTGLLSGTNDGKLNPKGFATRAQAASILMRYSENIKK